MGHRPHLHLPEPWPAGSIPLSGPQLSHLKKILRLDSPADVTYTNGRGTIGHGVFDGAAVTRGGEGTVARPSTVTMAVAPPRNRDRQRFLIEKLQEMGVSALLWLSTEFAAGRIPSQKRAVSWAIGALEQSQGAWLLEIQGERPTNGLEGAYVVCDRDGAPAPPPGIETAVVGPEGGWGPGEIAANVPRWSLGSTVLRVETAAVVAAARLINP